MESTESQPRRRLPGRGKHWLLGVAASDIAKWGKIVRETGLKVE
jgi:hypothetical protein